MLNRRQALAAGITLPSMIALSACGPNRTGADSGGGDGSEAVTTLRVVWWGNPTRTERTTAALDAFTEAEPGIDTAPEPAEWGGYWDRLGTQLAANDAPDVVQMDEKYLLEYVDRGALLELTDGVDVSSFGADTAALGEVDGTLYAINAGTIAPVMMANPALFEQAGVELPDDTTWTWEDLRELGAELTQKLPEGSYGVTDFSGRDAAFRVWVRQHGQETFTDDGVGFDVATAAGWFDLAKRMMDEQAAPPASLSAEDVSAAVDQRLFGTGTSALAIYSSNQITAFDDATGEDLRLLRLPSLTGSASDAQLAYQASMYWVVTAGSAAADAASSLVDFLVNDDEAGRIQLTERGVPANTAVLEAIQPDLSASDTKAIDYLAAIQPELGSIPPLTPRGASSFEDTLIRHGQDVLFGSATPEEAAQAFIDDVNSGIG